MAQDYDAFVEKFKPKKTTDDCYTPPEIYDVIRDWACEEYGIKKEDIVRPFWPGGDYQNFDYPEGCVVLDNPPFSIHSQICEWYLDRGIKFFLFAPTLTGLSGRGITMRMNHIICKCEVTYENGAVVHTSFVTNLGEPGIVAQTAPELTRRVNEAVTTLKQAMARHVPKYQYPDNVVTAAMMSRYAGYGIDFKVRAEDCVRISALDSQRPANKAIFGGGLLLSERAAAERAAAERAAAERAAAEVWTLSEREKDIIRALG